MESRRCILLHVTSAALLLRTTSARHGACPVRRSGWPSWPWSAAARFSARRDASHFMRRRTSTNGPSPALALHADLPRSRSRRVPGRRRNPRQAKTHRSYSIAEAAELYGVHRQTVRQWIGAGLSPNDATRPVLIHGTALNAFHASRRTSARRPCGPLELYCLRCRSPRRPAGDVADYVPMTDKVGTLAAICPECNRMMTQRVNSARLGLFRADIAVSDRPAPGALTGSDQRGLNHHLEKSDDADENQRSK